MNYFKAQMQASCLAVENSRLFNKINDKSRYESYEWKHSEANHKYLKCIQNNDDRKLLGFALKVITEKLKNGKTCKTDRKNDRNWLILVLNDTWLYEKDHKNTFVFEQLMYFYWGE